MAAPLLAVDAPSLLYRAFFALPKSITDADGRPVNALLGTANLRAAGRRAARPARRGPVLRRRGGGLPHRGLPALPRRPPADARRARRTSGPTRPAFFGAFGWPSLRRAATSRPTTCSARSPPAERAAGGRALLFTGDRDMFQCVDDAVAVLFPGGKDRPGARRSRRGATRATASSPRRSRTSSRCAATRPTACPAPAASARRAPPSCCASTARSSGCIELAADPAAQARRALKPRAAAALREQADELRSFRDIATLRPSPWSARRTAPLDAAGAAEAARARGHGAPRGPPGAHCVLPSHRLTCSQQSGIRCAIMPSAWSASARSRCRDRRGPGRLRRRRRPRPRRGRAGADGARDGLELPRRPRRPGRRPGLGRPAAAAPAGAPTTVPGVMDDALGAGRLPRRRSAGTASTFTAPAAPRRLRLGAALRARAARGARCGSTARRSAATPTRTCRSTCRARGLRPGAPQHARRPRRQPQGPAAARGLVELGRDHAPGPLVPRGAPRAARPRLPVAGRRARAAAAAAQRCCSTPLVVNRGAGAAAAPRSCACTCAPPGGGRAIDARSAPCARWRPASRRASALRVPVAATAAVVARRPGALRGDRDTLSAGGVAQQVDAPRRRPAHGRASRDGLLRLNGRRSTCAARRSRRTSRATAPALTDADIDGIVDELKAVARERHPRALPARRPPARRARRGRASSSGARRRSTTATALLRDRRPSARRALATLRGTVLAARSHPSVITHSVANELSAVPDEVPGHAAYLRRGARARRATSTRRVPPSVDMLSYPGYPRQADLRARSTLLGHQLLLRLVPRQGRPLDGAARRPRPVPGPHAAHVPALGARADRVRRRVDDRPGRPTRRRPTPSRRATSTRRAATIVDQRPCVGGAIYWTLREFAVKPDWDGGARPRPASRATRSTTRA